MTAYETITVILSVFTLLIAFGKLIIMILEYLEQRYKKK